jgi:hypothetical protein
MVSSDLLKEYKFIEEIEEVPGFGDPGKGSLYVPTGFPQPVKRFKLVWEVHELSIEEPYFWLYNHLSQDLLMTKVFKTEDTFSASENSAFFGVSMQRLGLNQDKVSQYLATIGKMVKELFQLVRELRILDERIHYYSDVLAQLKKPQHNRAKGSEITLKGIFIDLVQGGAKNPASVYGMARELEFTVLPDLFFNAPPMLPSEVEKYVDSLDFNNKALEVLKRHLTQFSVWKERTYDEHKTRRTFTLQYLHQHYEIIKMYMVWVKPYLRHVQRLQMRKGFESDPEIVSAFETSLVDIEFLSARPFGNYNSVILATFHYRTRPSLKFVQEGYQRGPIHVGKVTIHLRGYTWTNEQIKAYVDMKDAEDFELLRTVSGSVQAAMDALGHELKSYLDEAASAHKKKEQKGLSSEASETLTQKLFKDFINPKKKKKEKKPKQKDKEKAAGERGAARGDLKFKLFLVYKNFKKAHGMIQW